MLQEEKCLCQFCSDCQLHQSIQLQLVVKIVAQLFLLTFAELLLTPIKCYIDACSVIRVAWDIILLDGLPVGERAP